MELNKSLFIEKRNGKKHLDLNGEWLYCSSADQTYSVQNLNFDSVAKLPLSVGWCLYESGKCGHPYVGLNSKDYEIIADKAWYFKKKFFVDESLKDTYAYLCFDGASYYTRVWINGTYLGSHEGMFGGPIIEASELLKYGEENELIVETTAVNYLSRKKHLINANSWGFIKMSPWQLTNDSHTQNGHFNVVGLWRDIRIEFLPQYHIANPYIYTESIADNTAHMYIEVPVSTPFMNEQDGYQSCVRVIDDWPRNTYGAGILEEYNDDEITLSISVSDDDGKQVYADSMTKKPFDFKPNFHDERYSNDYLYFTGRFDIKAPKLWYPHTMGSQPLYNVNLEVFVNGVKSDEYNFKTGIRTVTAVESKAEKLYRRWENFQFVVNGEKIFLKGMNFTQTDQLLREDKNEIEWTLTLAKKQGISLVRIWNGGNGPESDYFYDVCDRLGLMVWQDAFIKNETSKDWDTDALRSQTVFCLDRIRNHPSFVVFCGGNEFNPYSVNNAASMYAMSDEAKVHVPDRIFYRTTPDGGSAHTYYDWEPTWYRHLFKRIQFIAESGIHNFPTHKTFTRILGEKELNTPLNNIFSDSFKSEFPELLNHFSEFIPARVPRMLARASHINDIRGIDLYSLVEATQMSAYEFYLIMIESMLENYPVTTGIMPWVFKRPWPTAAIQLVDGFGHPEAQYYGVKRAYEPIHPFVALSHLNYRSNETLKLPVKLWCDEGGVCGEIITEIFDDKFNKIFSVNDKVIEANKYCSDIAEYDFTIPETINNAYFFIRIRFISNGNTLGESFYCPKVLDVMNESDFYQKERAKPCGNIFFEKGPFLKKQVCLSGETKLGAEIVEKSHDSGRTMYKIMIKNEGDNIAYPVNVDTKDPYVRCVCSDNRFFLDVGEIKEIAVILDNPHQKDETIAISAWNSSCEIEL